MPMPRPITVLVLSLFLFSVHDVAQGLQAGDVDQSGTVDTADTAFLVELLLRGASTRASDLDANGTTDSVDYQILIRVLLGEDIDADDDGLSDTAEGNIGTDPGDPDSDGDGVEDGEEYVVHGSNPQNTDTDGDTLSDGEEVHVHHTNPNAADTDGDGRGDRAELDLGTDPVTANGFPSINEFLASNGGSLEDPEGESPDWIELYNGGAWPAPLAGWSLSDDAEDLGKWRFPNVSIPPGGYLVVYATGLDLRPEDGGRLHTNFGLSSDGEYLALTSPGAAEAFQALVPGFPPQEEDISYGYHSGLLRYFTLPTPGSANNPTNSYLGLVADTKFSVGRGFYDDPVSVSITSETPGAQVWYTLDGTPPSPENGIRYTAPLHIDGTTTLRAAAFRSGWRPTNTDTQTYIFVADIIQQDYQATLDRGFPTIWSPNTPDYGMDPDVIDQSGGDLFGGQYAETIDASLRSLPVFSIVMDLDDLFTPPLGIYARYFNTGPDWERPMSLEMIYPDGGDGFQIDAGIRIQGGSFRSLTLTKKKSFRLLFKREYGAGKLRYPLFGDDAVEEFDTLVLRMDSNDGWSWEGHPEVQYARDEFGRRSQRALGMPASHGIRVHLYINGAYWGLYNPVERPDSSFGAAYFGAERDEWDGINSGEPPTGENVVNAYDDPARQERALDNWNAFVDATAALAEAPDAAARNTHYQRLQGLNPDGTRNPDYPVMLDADNMILYFLTNFYSGNEDWPRKNYYVGRDSSPKSTGWKFFCWDSEWTLHMHSDVDSNVIDENRAVSIPFQYLRASEEFRMRFADKVHGAFFNQGVFYVGADRNVPLERYLEIIEEIEVPLVAESARWGDQHRELPYTVEGEWREEVEYLTNEYFPYRSALVLEQFRVERLYPTTHAPVFYIDGAYQHGGRIPPEATLTMDAAPGGGGGFASIAWGGVTPIQGVDDIDLSGTLVEARDLGPDTGTTRVRVGEVDIDFEAMDYGNITEDGHQRYPGFFVEPEGFDTSFGTVLDGMSYNGRNPKILTLRGLETAAVYQIQIFVSDDRLCCAEQTMEFRDPNGNASESFAAGDSVFVTGTFTAEGETQYIELQGLNSPFTYFNAYVLRKLSESKGETQEPGEIYYTLDGSDPRLEGGGVSPTAILYSDTAPPVLNGSVRVRARTIESGEWSAINEASYAPEVLGAALRITELMYHPVDSAPGVDGPEFVELLNISDAPVDLALASFEAGIQYTFTEGSLAPGSYAVLTNDLVAFESRYGTGIATGVYEGRLANDGEWIGMVDATGQHLLRLKYADDWWPSTDGGGHSLRAADPGLADPAVWSTKAAWLPSLASGGTPGAADDGAGAQ